jgi:hypothetical protein
VSLFLRHGVHVVSTEGSAPPACSRDAAFTPEPSLHGDGTTITLKLDIDAEAPADFPAEVISDVEANAKTLKCEQSGFL